MTIQIVAFILLALRALTIAFTLSVLKQQYRLFKMTIDSGLVQFRVAMFSLTMVFLVGSVIPVMVDIYYGLINTDANWNLVLVAYALSNSLSFLASSVLLWKIYQIVGAGLRQEQLLEDKRS